MTNSNPFNYKNFYQLLKLDNKQEQENQLKELIDNYLGHHFYSEDREWFNMLINYGLINLVKHCENTIDKFSLYDKSNDCHHKSNLSFLKAIQSGNLDLVDYFFNHKDFPLFINNPSINENIANFMRFYSTTNDVDLNNFEQLICKVANKFPLFAPIALNKIVLNHKNDELTPMLISFVKKNTDCMTTYLDNSPTENNLTRLCMVSFNYDCPEFGLFLKNHYKDINIQSDFLSFYLLYFGKLNTLNYILDNPDFFVLKEDNFTEMFHHVFENPLRTKATKEAYQFYFKVTKLGLHKVKPEEMQKAINSNLTPFVKKYYSQFKQENFTLWGENTCTNFIDKQIKEENYKQYLKKYPEKNIVTKKMKI